MSYSNQTVVHAVDAIEHYLNNKLPETKLWEHSFIKKQIDRREQQATFTIEDHIRGMIYSMLSSGAKYITNGYCLRKRHLQTCITFEMCAA